MIKWIRGGGGELAGVGEGAPFNGLNKEALSIRRTFFRLQLYKGDATQDYLQQRFLAQHSVAILEQCCNHFKQCCNNIAVLR